MHRHYFAPEGEQKTWIPDVETCRRCHLTYDGGNHTIPFVGWLMAIDEMVELYGKIEFRPSDFARLDVKLEGMVHNVLRGLEEARVIRKLQTGTTDKKPALYARTSWGLVLTERIGRGTIYKGRHTRDLNALLAAEGPVEQDYVLRGL